VCDWPRLQCCLFALPTGIRSRQKGDRLQIRPSRRVTACWSFTVDSSHRIMAEGIRSHALPGNRKPSGDSRLSSPEEDQKKSVPARTRRGPETPALPRTANQIIDQAIEDNKFTEHLLNGFATVFVACGLFTLVAGAIRNESLVTIAGPVATSLFYPAMRQARQIRRENIAIRLLESPLSKAETSHEASIAVKEFFSDTFKANP
jgi:hypothetical protein